MSLALNIGGHRNQRISKSMKMKKPHEVLRDIRKRTGMSGTAVAKIAGYKSASGYLRYENPEDKDKVDGLIPYHVIQQLMPLFVGKGYPPVTHDELLAISDVKSVPADVKASLGQLPRDMADSFVSSRGLPIRYRVEKGVYVDLSQREHVEDEGTSPILASLEFPQSSQFVVSVSSLRGVLLHCVEPGEVSVARATGKRAVIAAERGNTGLVEIVLGRTVKADDVLWVVESTDGKKYSGKPIGVVIWAYSREG